MNSRIGTSDRMENRAEPNSKRWWEPRNQLIKQRKATPFLRLFRRKSRNIPHKQEYFIQNISRLFSFLPFFSSTCLPQDISPLLMIFSFRSELVIFPHFLLISFSVCLFHFSAFSFFFPPSLCPLIGKQRNWAKIQNTFVPSSVPYIRKSERRRTMEVDSVLDNFC